MMKNKSIFPINEKVYTQVYFTPFLKKLQIKKWKGSTLTAVEVRLFFQKGSLFLKNNQK